MGHRRYELAEKQAKLYGIGGIGRHAWEHGFVTGYEYIEDTIKESINTLEELVEKINNKPLTEQIFLTRDLNTLKAKIEVLKSLLDEQ